MKRLWFFVIATVAFITAFTGPVGAASFNNAADNQTDAFGYYYIVTGGLFPTGPTPNGSSASGGTFRYITDDSAWGKPTQVWQKDGWFSDNAGFALTMKNGANTVYDNNGIEIGPSAYGDYYDGRGSHGTNGLYRGYSMSNNYDWIYAGYFKLANATTITQITGYFDGNGSSADANAFNPNSPSIRYRMNIWSNVAGDLLPVNTGGFAGDVLSTDRTAGTFAPSYAMDRIMPDGTTDPIWRLTYTLDNPVTLAAGEYWFSHDTTVVPLPPAVLLFAPGLLGIVGLRRRLKK